MANKCEFCGSLYTSLVPKDRIDYEGVCPHCWRAPSEKIIISKPEKVKYSKKDLEKLSFKELREIGYKIGTKGRSKEELIKEILELQ